MDLLHNEEEFDWKSKMAGHFKRGVEAKSFKAVARSFDAGDSEKSSKAGDRSFKMGIQRSYTPKKCEAGCGNEPEDSNIDTDLKERKEAVDSEGDEHKMPACPVPSHAPLQDKIDWFIRIGYGLRAKQAIVLPVQKWDRATEEESRVIDCVGFLFRAYEVTI